MIFHSFFNIIVVLLAFDFSFSFIRNNGNLFSKKNPIINDLSIIKQVIKCDRVNSRLFAGSVFVPSKLKKLKEKFIGREDLYNNQFRILGRDLDEDFEGDYEAYEKELLESFKSPKFGDSLNGK